MIYPLIGLLYMVFYITSTIIHPSEVPSDTSIRYIRWFYSMNHPGKIVSRSGNSTRCVLRHNSRSVTPCFFFEEFTRSQSQEIGKFRFLTHFLTLRPAGRLCVRIEDLPRAMRPKLVVILPSRTIFRLIFALRHLRDHVIERVV